VRDITIEMKTTERHKNNRCLFVVMWLVEYIVDWVPKVADINVWLSYNLLYLTKRHIKIFCTEMQRYQFI
jgi:hypothetical protein